MSPRLIPPHSVRKPYTNWPPSSIVTMLHISNDAFYGISRSANRMDSFSKTRNIHFSLVFLALSLSPPRPRAMWDRARMVLMALILGRLLSLSLNVESRRRGMGVGRRDGRAGGRRKAFQLPIPNGEWDLSPLNGSAFPPQVMRLDQFHHRYWLVRPGSSSTVI